MLYAHKQVVFATFITYYWGIWMLSDVVGFSKGGIWMSYKFKTREEWKKGFTSSARDAEPLGDLLIRFRQRCDRENLTDGSKRFYNEKLPKFLGFLEDRGSKYWQQVDKKDIEAWFAHIQTQGVSESYKQGWVRSTKTFLRWLVSEGLEGHIAAIPNIKQLQGRQYIPSPEVLGAFLRQIDQETMWGFRDYVVCMCIVDCGARIGEICGMHPDDVLWDQGMVRLYGKGRKERYVPVSNDQLFPLLKKWKRVREHYIDQDSSGKDRLFINRAGGKCTPNTFSQVFRKHRIRTGLGNQAQGTISAHTLRHYFCTMYLINGGSIEILQRIAGHEDINTTMVYLHHANRIGVMKTDHTKVSPMKKFLAAGEVGPERKRRSMS
jgi:integrase/recombinase XerD